MLHTGEFYYFLAPLGQRYVKADGLPLSARACKRISVSLQKHEFELSRFLIKFWSDGEKIRLSTEQFWRDGSFRVPVIVQGEKTLVVPDATVLIHVRGKPRLFFVELDCSTEVTGLLNPGPNTFMRKLERYLAFLRSTKARSAIGTPSPSSIRVVVVCLTEARVEYLREVARQLGIRRLVQFTCVPRFVDLANPTARGWQYRPAQMFSAPLFSPPGRSPPRSLL